MENDIRDIKGLIYYDIRLIYLLVLLGLVALVIAFILFLRKRKRPSVVKEEMPILPPDVVALNKIRELKELKLIEQGKIKEFYIMLSDIIRAFIEDKYKISALDRTTYELITELKSKNVIRSNIGVVHDFLFDCDLVKFAKYIPPVEDSNKILMTAEEIININQ